MRLLSFPMADSLKSVRMFEVPLNIDRRSFDIVLNFLSRVTQVRQINGRGRGVRRPTKGQLFLCWEFDADDDTFLVYGKKIPVSASPGGTEVRGKGTEELLLQCQSHTN